MVRAAAAGSVSRAAGTATLFSRSSSRARILRWTASDDADRSGPARRVRRFRDRLRRGRGSPGWRRRGTRARIGAASPHLLPAPFPPSADRTEDSDPHPPTAAARFRLLLVEFMARSSPADMRKARQQCRPPRAPRSASRGPRDGQSAGRTTPIAEDLSKQLRRRRKHADAKVGAGETRRERRPRGSMMAQRFSARARASSKS